MGEKMLQYNLADYARLANWLADNPPANDENIPFESADI